MPQDMPPMGGYAPVQYKVCHLPEHSPRNGAYGNHIADPS